MAIPAHSEPRKRRSRLRWAAPLALALVATSVGTIESMAAPQPVGVPSVQPIQFNLLDDQGKWYDSGLNLFGDQSLAVATLPGTGVAGGNASAQQARALMNADVGDKLLHTTPANGGPAPRIGTLGVDPLKAVGLDSVLTTLRSVAKADPKAAADAAQAEVLIHQLAPQLAAKPVNESVSLVQMPTGANLMKALDRVRADSPGIGAVTAKFDIAPPAVASAHTITSIIWPKDAPGFPFDQAGAFVGQTQVQLTKPGLYAFACKVHPYMLGAVVVDDPLTPGVDFGKELTVKVRGDHPGAPNEKFLDVPSNADIIQQLVKTFFNITNPGNWQHYSNTEARTWDPQYPPAPILEWDKSGAPALVPNLNSFFHTKFGFPKTLPALTQRPSVPGVGDLWVDTQMEKYAGKVKSGAATEVNPQNWTVVRKIAAPGINMNNPHNMWTDNQYKYLYQTEWFNNKVDVFDRATGAFVRDLVVGPDPSHVMTRPDTDQLHIAINGGGDVVEAAPGATKIDRRIPVGNADEKIKHPHAHWMEPDPVDHSITMITPNVNTYDASLIDVPSGTHRKEDVTGDLPIATGMMPDASKAYTADFLGQSVTCISTHADACNNPGGVKTHNKDIDLWQNYDPVTGPKGGVWGGLPIQIPVSPDGKLALVANTLTQSIAVIDTSTDTVIKDLPCDPGCHGINFGAKKGGGYYAYVSSKFSNAMEIVDPDPNGDGKIDDAAVVGKMVLEPDANTKMDDQITDYSGLGGQGVLAIPLVYNGWSQKIPEAWRKDLTCRQINPITPSAC